MCAIKEEEVVYQIKGCKIIYKKSAGRSKGPFIIYGREGAGDFGEGATYFWQVAERGGHLFLASRLEVGPLIFGAKFF